MVGFRPKQGAGNTDNRRMHLIISLAYSHAESAAATAAQLSLPNLKKLLARLHAQAPDTGDELSLSPPHERALARALGLPLADGQIPWAALQASQRPELAAFGQGWAFVSLCHWQLHSHHVTLSQLPLTDLSADESDALLAAMQPYFAEDGIALHPDRPGRWLAQGPVFADLASASPDRVLGRNLQPWMPDAPEAAVLRRLQNEMQMLLYTHPVVQARSARGATPVNAFWVHGSGVLPGPLPAPAAAPSVVDTLRAAALQEDWAAWAQAWQALDAGPIAQALQAAQAGQAVQLTLCGERHSRSWHSGPQSLWRQVQGLIQAAPAIAQLQQL